MKKLFNKINELWLKIRGWSNTNIFGYFLIKIIKVISLIAIALLIFYYLFIIGPFKDNETSKEPPVADSSDTVANNCNIQGINVHGTIQTYIPEHAEGDTNFDYDSVGSENVIGSIRQANNDPKIKAIILEVDSSGGYPVAGEEISNAVKNSKKPVVGLIRETGASAAYWAVSGASRIFGSKNSDIGSIGVTSSYLSNVEKNKKEGYKYEKLSAGKFKDSGKADLPLTEEEKNLFMRDINIIYLNFIEAVSINRNIPIEEVKKIADGSSMLGQRALEYKLIDEIGGIYEVEKYLEEKIGEKTEVCWE